MPWPQQAISPEAIIATYARIGDVAKEYGVTLRTLRFYEDKGLINATARTAARVSTRAATLSRLRLVLLGRQVGFTLREVKQMMDLYDPGQRQCASVARRGRQSPSGSCRG